MKFVNLVTVAFLTLSSTAFSKTIVKFDFNGDAPKNIENTMAIVETELSDNGVLNVKESIYGDYNFANLIAQRTVQFQLSSSVMARLVDKASMVADAELKTTHSRYVCHMMPMPGATRSLKVATLYNPDTKQFDGELRTVISPEGCWIARHTFPKETYILEHARTLREVIEFLSLQALAHD